LTEQDAALLRLLKLLSERGYSFVTPTPDTHRIVWRRPMPERGLREIFGWSRAFDAADLEPEVLEAMAAGGVLAKRGRRFASRVRVSTVHERLYMHSAFPPKQKDAVFLGPDTYRFADFIRRELADVSGVRTVVDIGTGAGVGAVTAAACCPDAEVIGTDINDRAVQLARVNAAHAGVRIDCMETNALDAVAGPLDLVVANPPYIGSDSGRTYRDGGGMLGAQLSFDWARAAAQRLSPHGRLLLYTGSAIVAGQDRFRTALAEMLEEEGCDLRYDELDPDVFGSQLRHPAYFTVERIAAVGAVAVKRA
jgi:methylase of polypeptide subunit release factors